MAFPTIASENGNASTSGSLAVAMPSGISAGDLLIVFVAHDTTAPGGISQSGGSDWSRVMHEDNTQNMGAIFAKIAAGGDTLTVTDNGDGQDLAAVSVRITGHGVSDVTSDITYGTPSSGTSATPDPPNCDPGVADDYLWIETFMADDDNNAATYWSTDYTGVRQQESAQTSTSCMVAVAYRQLNAASENPGSMAQSPAQEWIAQTLAIPPAAAASDFLYPKISAVY